jgi:hypothetical protein
MYATERSTASEIRDVEARLVHRLDQLDAKWQHQMQSLETRVDSDRRFLEGLLQLFWLSTMVCINLLIWSRIWTG